MHLEIENCLLITCLQRARKDALWENALSWQIVQLPRTNQRK